MQSGGAGKLRRSMRAEPGVSAARDRAYYQERRQAQARAARLRRLIAVGAVGVLAVLAVGIGLGFAGSTDRIAAGVTIGGVEVGGMTAEEARRALAARYSAVRRRAGRLRARRAALPGRPGHGGRLSRTGTSRSHERSTRATASCSSEASSASRCASGATTSRSSVSPASRRSRLRCERLGAEIDRPARDAALVLNGDQPAVRPAAGRRRARPRSGRRGRRRRRSSASTASEPDRAAGHGGRARGARSRPRSRPREQLRMVLSGAGPAHVPQADVHRSSPSGPRRPLRAARRWRPRARDRRRGGRRLLQGPRGARSTASLSTRTSRSPPAATRASCPRRKVAHSIGTRRGRRCWLPRSRPTPDGRNADLVVARRSPSSRPPEAKAMGIVDVVSAYTTVYGGDPNRLHNVRLVSQLIDDHLIAPGETFSFNETTGERNADQGFLEAPVIINGELQTGLGGGVCQVSTTVFNAAFEAGLSIEERTNHALYISHYPTGRDATVNFPDTDLKFTNDTGNWLWLRAFVGASELTIALYGTPVDRRVEIERRRSRSSVRRSWSGSSTRRSRRARGSSRSAASLRGRSRCGGSSTTPTATCSTTRSGPRATCPSRGSSGSGRSRRHHRSSRRSPRPRAARPSRARAPAETDTARPTGGAHRRARARRDRAGASGAGGRTAGPAGRLARGVGGWLTVQAAGWTAAPSPESRSRRDG